MRNIKERIMRAGLSVTWKLEDKMENVRGYLTSCSNQDNFFVRVLANMAYAVEWVAVEVTRWLEFVERNEMFKGCDFLDDDDDEM